MIMPIKILDICGRIFCVPYTVFLNLNIFIVNVLWLWFKVIYHFITYIFIHLHVYNFKIIHSKIFLRTLLDSILALFSVSHTLIDLYCVLILTHIVYSIKKHLIPWKPNTKLSKTQSITIFRILFSKVRLKKVKM